jgi:hypothetical protein
MQLERARCRARVENVTAAVAEDPKASGSLLYQVARVYALAVTAEEDRQREVYAGQALALLRRARAASFFKDPVKVAPLNQDTDVGPLWPRDDFQKFVAALEAEDMQAPEVPKAGDHGQERNAAGAPPLPS